MLPQNTEQLIETLETVEFNDTPYCTRDPHMLTHRALAQILRKVAAMEKKVCMVSGQLENDEYDGECF